MSLKISKRASVLQPSVTFELSSKVSRMREAGQEVISLGLGEPDDIDTPLHIKAAAIDAIHDGKTKYTPVDGIPSLKQAICQKLLQDNDLEYNPYQVIVSNGSKQAIHNALNALVEPGDEVILIAPYWTSYMDNVLYTGADAVVVPTTIRNGFKVNPNHLAEAISEKTRVLILNSPTNPSGASYSVDELKLIARVLKKHPNITIISDEIYEHILWSGTPYCNILNACPVLTDRTIIINGLSKGYAMTGWRIGYAAGPQEIILAMKKIQSQSTASPCSIAQYAALEALDGNQRAIEQMLKTYQSRHNIAFLHLQKIPGCEVIPAQGGYYLFPDVTKVIQTLGLENDVELADYILEKGNVCVIPGSAFGMENHIRISFVTSEDKLRQALERLETLLNPESA